MNVKFVKVVRGLMLCGLLVVPCVFLQVEFNLFGDINSNTFSFLAYMGISLSFIWFKCADKKISPIMCMIVGYYCILRTGSRNVAIVVLICFALLLIPRRIWERAWFFRCVYILAIVYTIMAVYIMEVGFDNSAISDLLNDFVDSFSDKAWEMEGRVDFLLEIQLKLRNKGIVEQLLGSGIAKHHGHNLFYQSVFAYGYLGTLLIYITYVIMFEMAYKIIRMQNDSFVLGSVIIMVGHFLIQGADVYMLGTEGCIVMPAVIMGLIMQQYREKFILHRNVLEASINICK